VGRQTILNRPYGPAKHIFVISINSAISTIQDVQKKELPVVELWCEIKLYGTTYSVRRPQFCNVYKYDVIITSSAAMNI